jgi:hypothetical protein
MQFGITARGRASIHLKMGDVMALGRWKGFLHNRGLGLGLGFSLGSIFFFFGFGFDVMPYLRSA